MRRSFTQRQKRILSWVAGGRCLSCDSKLDASFHADHVLPFSKGGPTTKLHAVVDEYGTLVAIVVTAGNVNDCSAAPVLLKDLTYKTILADKAYDTVGGRLKVYHSGTGQSVPPRGHGEVMRIGGVGSRFVAR